MQQRCPRLCSVCQLPHSSWRANVSETLEVSGKSSLVEDVEVQWAAIRATALGVPALVHKCYSKTLKTRQMPKIVVTIASIV